jgi:hypothetical protein
LINENFSAQSTKTIQEYKNAHNNRVKKKDSSAERKGKEKRHHMKVIRWKKLEHDSPRVV